MFAVEKIIQDNYFFFQKTHFFLKNCSNAFDGAANGQIRKDDTLKIQET
jgi:hypothetical protein